MEQAATIILDISAKKVLDVAEPIIKEYKLKKERVALIGGGGGASVHVHYIASKQHYSTRLQSNQTY